MNSQTKSSFGVIKLKLLFKLWNKTKYLKHMKIKRQFPFLKLISVPLENNDYLTFNKRYRSLEPNICSKTSFGDNPPKLAIL